MFYRLVFLTSALFAATPLITAPAQAQADPTASTIVATVGDVEITLGHMLALRTGLPPHYDELPDEVLFSGILDQLIQQTLLMQMVEGKPDPLTLLMIENERRALLASESIRRITNQPITKEDLQAAFDAAYKNQKPETEYHAAHILVASEDEAKAIITEIEGGADFAMLAQTHSTGPSGPNGGDLGWFGAGVMVEPFFDAVTQLEPGTNSAPVETQFGWHVIKLIEIRTQNVPKLDDVREILEEEIRQEAFDKLLEERAAQTKIDRSGADAINRSVIKSSDILEN